MALLREITICCSNDLSQKNVLSLCVSSLTHKERVHWNFNNSEAFGRFFSSLTKHASKNSFNAYNHHRKEQSLRIYSPDHSGRTRGSTSETVVGRGGCSSVTIRYMATSGPSRQ